MAGKDLTFKLVMDADVKSFVTNLKQSEAQAKAIFELIRQESERLRQSTASGAGGIDQLDRSLQSTTNTANQFDRQITTVNNDLNHTETSASAATTQAHALESAFSKLMMTLAALGIGVTAKEMLDTADSYKTLAASVRVAIGEHGNLDQAMQNIIGVALRTNTSLEATAQLYTKITTATKDMGAQQQSVFLRAANATAAFKLSQQDILGLTETINKAVQVSGGPIESAEAGLFQLNQSLSSGVLRGEEFNSVMEQTPRLARAMADGLGVTIGQLRNMANNGQLTSEVVTKALLSQASVINGEFSKFPLTIGAATQNLKTSWTVYLGELDKTTGVTTSVAKGIKLLADNLDSIVATFKTVIEVIGAYKATQLVAYLNNKSAAFTNAANSIRYSTTQLSANSVADAMKKVSDSFNFTNLDGINNGITALSALQAKGIATGEDIRKALANGLQGQDLLVFKTNFSVVGAQIKSEMDAVYQDLAVKKKAYDDFVKNSDGLSYNDFKAQSQKYQDDIDVTQAKITTLQTQYNNSVQSTALVHGAVLDEAIRRTGMSYEELSGKSTKAFISAKNDVDITVASLDELKARGVDTGKAVGLNINNAIKAATNQEELDGLKTKVEGLRGILGDKIADGLLQQIDEQMLSIKTRSDEAVPGINSVTEAFGRFGLVTKEQANVASNSLIDSFNVMRNSGKATAEQLKQALVQMADKIYASGNTAKIAWYESQLAINGLTDSVDGMGKHSVSAATQTVDSVDAILKSTTRASGGFKNLGDSATEQANRVSDAWDSAANSVSNAAKAGEKVTASNLWLTQDYIAQQLKSKGYDDAKAQSLAKQIYDQTKGQSGIGATLASRDYYLSHGYTDSMYAQMRTGSANLSNYAAVDEQLQKYADLAAQKSKTTTNTTSAAASSVTTPTMTNQAGKTVRIEIINGQRKSVVYGDQQSADDLVTSLETINKAGGGYK